MKLGLISGVHEDVVSLRAALDRLEQLRCDAVACLGDIVGFSVPYFGFPESRDAHEAVRLVRGHCTYVITGNHDLHAVRRLPTHSTFAYPKNWYELDWESKSVLSQGQVWLYEEDLPATLNDADIEYLRSLPECLTISVNGANVFLSHFAFPDLVGDSKTSDPVGSGLADHFEFMHQYQATIGVSGHDPHDGAVVHTRHGRSSVGFGLQRLPNEPVWIEVPWVANGTSANGFVTLELPSGVLQTQPLGTPPHVVPKS
jgi:hypothetical protein